MADPRRNLTAEVGPATDGRRGAPLARLLGLAMGVIGDALMARLAAAGYGDQRPAHNAVFANIPPEGIRLTELAERAGMSKQAMSELVGDLDRLGYLHRRPDPADGRAKLIEFTDRGWAAVRVALEAFDEIEAGFAQKVGHRRMKDLRDTLSRLTDGTGSR